MATYIKGMRVFVWWFATGDIGLLGESRAIRHEHRLHAVAVALTQLGAPSMPLMRRRQTMNAAPTPRCNRHCRACAAFLQHRAATCTHMSLKHRQRPRGL